MNTDSTQVGAPSGTRQHHIRDVLRVGILSAVIASSALGAVVIINHESPRGANSQFTVAEAPLPWPARPSPLCRGPFC